MTGELHHIRHLIVPPTETIHGLHPNAQEYLDNHIVVKSPQNRQAVAEKTRRLNFDNWFWTTLEILTAFLAGMLAGALLTLRLLGVGS